MAKGIIVVDMPENCRDCEYFGMLCKITNEKCHYCGENGKPDWCPIKPAKQWIPVEERLPETGEYVLGTNKYDEVLVYHYGWNSPHTKKMFFSLCGAAADIIAWMPLPEPYRPEEDENYEKDDH